MPNTTSRPRQNFKIIAYVYYVLHTSLTVYIQIRVLLEVIDCVFFVRPSEFLLSIES